MGFGIVFRQAALRPAENLAARAGQPLQRLRQLSSGVRIDVDDPPDRPRLPAALSGRGREVVVTALAKGTVALLLLLIV
jgi:hypothetical protein